MNNENLSLLTMDVGVANNSQEHTSAKLNKTHWFGNTLVSLLIFSIVGFFSFVIFMDDKLEKAHIANAAAETSALFLSTFNERVLINDRNGEVKADPVWHVYLGKEMSIAEAYFSNRLGTAHVLAYTQNNNFINVSYELVEPNWFSSEKGHWEQIGFDEVLHPKQNLLNDKLFEVYEKLYGKIEKQAM